MGASWVPFGVPFGASWAPKSVQVRSKFGPNLFTTLLKGIFYAIESWNIMFAWFGQFSRLVEDAKSMNDTRILGPSSVLVRPRFGPSSVLVRSQFGPSLVLVRSQSGPKSVLAAAAPEEGGGGGG